MTGVSLVMATMGRTREVERFVAHLVTQTCRDYELIVVDQNPDERLIPLLDEARNGGVVVKHLRQTEANQCKARNLGLASATFDWVAFPDDDCWYEADVIEKVIAIISGPVELGGVVARWEETDPVGSHPHALSNDLWREFREVGASAITQFFQRRVILRLGGFDPALGLHSWFGGGEETDLMFRVLATGATVTYTPDIVVHHPAPAPGLVSPRQAFKRARGRARGTGALYAKHRLSLWVICRGLVAPLMRSIANIHNLSTAAAHFGAALGRLEGWRRWPRNNTGPQAFIA